MDFPPVGEGGIAVPGGGGYCQTKSPRITKDPDDENTTDGTDRPCRQKEDAFAQEGETRGLTAILWGGGASRVYSKQETKSRKNATDSRRGNTQGEREDVHPPQNRKSDGSPQAENSRHACYEQIPRRIPGKHPNVSKKTVPAGVKSVFRHAVFLSIDISL